MSGVRDIFVVVRQNGRADTINSDQDYWSILEGVYSEYQSADSDWNQPEMLLRNGEVVCAKGLADLAWRYGGDKRSLMAVAHSEAKAKHTPTWLELANPS